jgi:hypothetical protein
MPTELPRKTADPLNGGSISFGSYAVSGWPMSTLKYNPKKGLVKSIGKGFPVS